MQAAMKAVTLTHVPYWKVTSSATIRPKTCVLLKTCDSHGWPSSHSQHMFIFAMYFTLLTFKSISVWEKKKKLFVNLLHWSSLELRWRSCLERSGALPLSTLSRWTVLNPSYFSYFFPPEQLFTSSQHNPNPTLSLFFLSLTMDEGQPLNNVSIHGGRRIDSVLRGPTISTTTTTTFSFPLTRYPSRLFAATDSRRILLGEGDGNGEGERCAYAKPILVLDVVWNLAFVLASLVVLLSTFREKPSTPLRLWISGYAFQCVLHVGFVCFDYRRRGYADLLGFGGFSFSQRRTSILKRLESANTIVSSIWWMCGFYWIVVGGQTLLQDSPLLYWLTVVFLAFDVFFIIFCVGMAIVIFVAFCCCIPIVAFAYSMAIRDGASEDDIRNLPKYRFCQGNSSITLDDDKNHDVLRAQLEPSNNKHTKELALNPEDSECCICLSQYVDGTELYTLPCSHHFHCGCISKWLQINATCPLCKFNILRSDTLV